MEEEVPPIPEHAKLPSMIQLYRRDLHYITRLSEEEKLHYLHTFLPEHRQAFYESCLWLPLRIVCRICSTTPIKWFDVMDMLQEGNIGLMGAIERAHGQAPFVTTNRFYAYAATHIKGAIYDFYSRNALIYIPRFSRRRSIAKNGEQAKETFHVLQSTMSLNTLMCNEKFDIPETPHREESQIHVDVERYLSLLSTVERNVVILHYGLDGGPAYHYQEIAEMMDRSFSGVRRIHKEALQRIAGTLQRSVRERQAQERDENMASLLKEWQAKGVKITIKKFREEVRCDGKAAHRFLREQGAIRQKKKSIQGK